MNWTPERIEQLTALAARGLTASQIATEIGGITRMSVLELCAESGIPAAVAPVPRTMLEEDADEVFTATTAGGVMPISRVGTRILGNDRPGPLSVRLKELYWRRHEEGWHRTPVRYETVDA